MRLLRGHTQPLASIGLEHSGNLVYICHHVSFGFVDEIKERPIEPGVKGSFIDSNVDRIGRKVMVQASKASQAMGELGKG
jgi:hypothetical protein